MALDTVDMGHMSIGELGIKAIKGSGKKTRTTKPITVVDYGHMGIEECGLP
jgi:hypothetical protein